MHKPLLAALALTLGLGACGTVRDSRLNPMNWFGRDNVETLVPAGGWSTGTDRRALVAVVSEMEMIPTTGGALLRASGQTATQGYWDVELRPLNDARPVAGELIYEFVAASPRTPMAAPTDAARTLTAAVKITNERLAGVRRVTVRGAQNARSVNR